MDLAVVMDELGGYIRQEFLEGDPSAELTPSSPLLEWGIINSMNSARLIAFIHERFGASVSPMNVNSTNLRDIESISRMVVEIRRKGQHDDQPL